MPLRRSSESQVTQLRVELQRRAQTWAPATREISRWVSAALGGRAQGHEIGVRVVGPQESRRLNALFRGRDKPTNVLSFPASELPMPQDAASARPLGDLVICAQVLKREAREQTKDLKAHWAHLIVHGTLHLIGYDHELSRDALKMERREIRVLRELGFANPYRST